MPAELPAQIVEHILTRAAEMSLRVFIEQAWSVLEPATPFVPGWHLDCVAEHLEAVTRLEIKNLMISIPPGHCKSLSVSVFWPAWVWITKPHHRWLAVAYGDHLVKRDSDRTRMLVNSPWYQHRWGHSVSLRKSSIERLETTKTGWRIGTTVGGQSLGERPSTLIADDANDAAEIRSEAARKSVTDWWSRTAVLRGADPATYTKVIIQQRLHANDLTGYCIANNFGYEHLVLPFEYEPRRIFLPGANGVPRPRDAIIPTLIQRTRPELMDPRTAEGDVLWPEMFKTPEVVASLKKQTGTQGHSGPLQQRPSPEEGEIFKQSHFKYFTERSTADGPAFVLGPEAEDAPPPRVVLQSQCQFFQTCDTAMTDNATSKYTVVGTFALTPTDRDAFGQITAGGELLVVDVVRKKLSIPLQMEFIREAWDKWPQCVFHGVESKASGIGLLQQGRLQGTPFRDLKARGTKEQRAASLAIMYENGQVYHKLGADWLIDFEEELCVVPETLIITMHGLKRADSIAVGDMALTHKGRFRAVSRVGKRTANKIRRIASKGADDLLITPNHPVLSMSLTKVNEDLVPMGVDWKLAGDMSPRLYELKADGTMQPARGSYDAVVFPVLEPEYVVSRIDLRAFYDFKLPMDYRVGNGGRRKWKMIDDGQTIRPNDKSQPLKYLQEMTYEFGMFCGLYLAEGSCTQCNAQFSFHTKETNLHEAVRSFAANSLGLRMSKQTPRKTPNSTICTISVSRLGAFFETFGHGALNKKIPWWAWYAPKDFHRGMVDGWVLGDAEATCSPDLAWGMRILSHRLGVWPSMAKTDIRGKEVVVGRAKGKSNGIVHKLSLREKQKTTAILTEEYAGLYVKDNSTIDGDQEVWNIEVEEDHSYVTTGGCVHNCDFNSGQYNDQVDVASHAAICATTDALLRTAATGQGIVYPELRVGEDGRILPPPPSDDLYSVTIGGHEITFDDREDVLE